MPEELTFEEAAALPLAGLTAHQALERLGLRAARRCSSPAAPAAWATSPSSSPLARGAKVIATGSPASHDFLRELGAEPMDYADGDVREPGARAHLRRRRGRRVRPVRRRGARAGVRLAAPRRAPGLDRRPPPEPREHLEVGYIFVRPSGYDLGEHITPLVHEGALRPHVAETFALDARRRGARAARGRARARQAGAHGRLSAPAASASAWRSPGQRGGRRRTAGRQVDVDEAVGARCGGWRARAAGRAPPAISAAVAASPGRGSRCPRRPPPDRPARTQRRERRRPRRPRATTHP